MIIDCISDLHGFFPTLKGGDLLIVAGDLTAQDTEAEYFRFFDWVHEQDYTKKIIIGGNHDNELEKQNYKGPTGSAKAYFEYLCDSGTEFEGLKVWGSPWTKTFPNMNPHCKAFTFDNEKELEDKFSLIPDDTNILITHSPPYEMLDELPDYDFMSVGSKSLAKRIIKLKKLQLHVFGHIHEGYGEFNDNPSPVHFVNASHVNEFYRPVNEPIRVVL